MRRLHQLQVMIRNETCQISSSSDVTSMDTMREIVLLERMEDNMLPPLALIQTHLKRMKIREMRINSSKPNARLSMTVDKGNLFDLIIKPVVDCICDSEGYYP
jgi:hypothetical protein